MAFYHLVTNEELDQSVVLSFSAKALLVMVDARLGERLKWAAGDQVTVMIDTDVTPFQLKITKSSGTHGWQITKSKNKKAEFLCISVRQLATVKMRNRRKADAIVNDGEIVLTLPKEFEIAQPSLVRKVKRARGSGADTQDSLNNAA